jgi:alanine racemase
MNVDAVALGLEPALALRSYVAAVKQARSGQSAGYGRRFVAARDTWLATVPIGYGDGVDRGLTNNCDVLIGGRRYPLVGTVSMDNITVDLGPEPSVEIGQQVTLIGSDRDDQLRGPLPDLPAGPAPPPPRRGAGVTIAALGVPT